MLLHNYQHALFCNEASIVTCATGWYTLNIGVVRTQSNMDITDMLFV